MRFSEYIYDFIYFLAPCLIALAMGEGESLLPAYCVNVSLTEQGWKLKNFSCSVMLQVA